MCGLVAAIGPDHDVAAGMTGLEAALAHMRRRGPDAAHLHSGPGFALGGARLRIRVPTPRADLPYGDGTGRHVAFNGEIFNAAELRRELSPASPPWRTGCEAEILLAAYRRWGDDFAQRLEGQFAIAIHDRARRALILARDRFGICPLFVARMGETTIAASSLRAILAGFGAAFAHLDRDGVTEYLVMRYPLAPRTVIAGIEQLEPGHLAVCATGQVTARRYWSLPAPPATAPSRGAAEAQLGRAIEAAVAGNCQSDRPIGLFLSGGLDSTIVATLAAARLPRHTPAVTLDLPGSASEIAPASAVAARLGLRHIVVSPDETSIAAAIPATIDALDTPNGARDALAVLLLARAMKAHAPDVRSILTGTGADELFGGYRNAYFGPSCGTFGEQLSHYVTCYAATSPGERDVLWTLVGPAALEAIAARMRATMAGMMPWLDAGHPQRLLNAFYLAGHLAGWELPLADQLCMAQSLEPRVPLLDTRVATLAMHHAAADARPNRDKPLLRRAARAWLPRADRQRPKLPLSRGMAPVIAHSAPFRDWRPTRLPADLAAAAGRSWSADSGFDLRWRLFVLDRWIARHLPAAAMAAWR